MCHHVFIQGFPVTSTANDPWNVGKYGDLHGFTQMDDPMMIDILRSCAKDKPVISAEMLMLPGYTLDLPQPVDDKDIKRFIFSGVAGNLKGFIFWQYRPEILGREAPTWGLSHLDGSMTRRLKDYAETGKVLTQNARFLLRSNPPQAETAIIYHPENQIFAWLATKNEKSATDSLLGIHRALYERNFTLDFLHPMEFEKDIPDHYKLIIAPFPYVLGEKICRKLEKWVKAGGTLISESYFGGWHIEEGCHAQVIPGYGMHKLFKIRHKEAIPVTANNPQHFTLNEDLAYTAKGESVPCFLISERLFNDGAHVLAAYAGGEPAVTMAEAERGRAIYISSFTGLLYQREKINAWAALLAGLAEKAGINKVQVSEHKKIRVDLLEDPDQRLMLIIQNHEEKACNAEIILPALTSHELTEQFTSEDLKISEGKFKISLELREVKVFL
jgi:beta-galactosidase